MDNPETLSTGKYNIEFSDKGTFVYALDEMGEKTWVATAADPELAMNIVEGLILVEHKRFYHPDAQPVVSNTSAGAGDKPLPPFLQNRG